MKTNKKAKVETIITGCPTIANIAKAAEFEITRANCPSVFLLAISQTPTMLSEPCNESGNGVCIFKYFSPTPVTAKGVANPTTITKTINPLINHSIFILLY